MQQATPLWPQPIVSAAMIAPGVSPGRPRARMRQDVDEPPGLRAGCEKAAVR